MRILVALQKFHHGHVVGKAGGGADNLIKVRRIAGHLLQRFIELLGGTEIVKREHQGGFRPQLIDLSRFQSNRALEFHIH